MRPPDNFAIFVPSICSDKRKGLTFELSEIDVSAPSMLDRRQPTPQVHALLGVETSLFRTLLAVVEAKSFVGAARIIHRTPAAVSMQMKKLEQQTGLALFVHKARTVDLTPAGEALLSYARRTLCIAEEVSGRLLALRQMPIRLGMTDEYALAFLPAILKRLANKDPAFELEVTCRLSHQLVVMLDDGLIDLALLTADSSGRPSPLLPVVHRDKLVWAGLAEGKAHRQRPLPVAVGPASCAWRRAAFDALDRADVGYKIVMTSDSYAGQLAPVLAGLAVVPLPRAVLPAGIAEVRNSADLPGLPDFELALRRSHVARDEQTSQLLQHLGEYFREMEERFD